MSTGARRNVRRDGGRVVAVARDNDGWTWTVIFSATALCALSLAVLFSVGTS